MKSWWLSSVCTHVQVSHGLQGTWSEGKVSLALLLPSLSHSSFELLDFVSSHESQGALVTPLAKQRRGLSPNGYTWRSTPSGATALPPTSRTILPSLPLSLRVSKFFRPPSFVSVVFAGV